MTFIRQTSSNRFTPARNQCMFACVCVRVVFVSPCDLILSDFSPSGDPSAHGRQQARAAPPVPRARPDPIHGENHTIYSPYYHNTKLWRTLGRVYLATHVSNDNFFQCHLRFEFTLPSPFPCLLKPSFTTNLLPPLPRPFSQPQPLPSLCYLISLFFVVSSPIIDVICILLGQQATSGLVKIGWEVDHFPNCGDQAWTVFNGEPCLLKVSGRL